MGWGYRIASIIILALLGVIWFASVYGWGLKDTARAQAEAIRRQRTGSGGIRSSGVRRGYYGGGYRYGK